MAHSMLAWTTISQFSSSSRIIFKLSKGTTEIPIDQFCVSFEYLDALASRVDEEERKKEEKMRFLKSNISHCVYAFWKVMMFSRSV